MNPATIRVATCNAKKELGPAAAKAVVRAALAAGDIVVWQEIETAAHKAAIANSSTHDTYWPKGSANAVPISFRKTRFSIVTGSKRKPQQFRQRILLGIRRVTPDRWTTWVVLRDHVTNQTFAVQNTHLISQAFTKHRERRSKWDRCANRVSKRAATIVKNRHALIGGGDMNRNKWAPDGTKGVWAKTGTVGTRGFYDTLFYAGAIELVGNVERIPTVSDHDILFADFKVSK